MTICNSLVHNHSFKATLAGYSVIFLFFFCCCFQTHLVRPGKILAIRIHAETVGYAARVLPDLFAIAQTDLRESVAT